MRALAQPNIHFFLIINWLEMPARGVSCVFKQVLSLMGVCSLFFILTPVLLQAGSLKAQRRKAV